MRSWSCEVRKPETINYRLSNLSEMVYFVQKFLDLQKFMSACVENIKRLKHRGVICEKCGVEVTLSESKKR